MIARFWLTHHVEEQHDRCAKVGSTLVCRRCLSSYPAALTMMGLSLGGIHWPAAYDPVLLWGLASFAIIDFMAEHLGWVTYNPRRQQVLSIIGGIAFGRGLGRYLRNPGDHLFWTISVTYSLVMVAAVVLGSRRERNVKQAIRQHESDEWWAGVEATADAHANQTSVGQTSAGHSSAGHSSVRKLPAVE